MRNRNPATIAGICTVAGLLVALAVLAVIPWRQARVMVAEGGLIESLSVLVIAVGVMAAGLKTWRVRNLVWGTVLLMLLWMFLRELDCQKLFTQRSIESIGFYSNPQIGLGVKLAALAALTPFALAGLYLVYVTAKAIRRSRAVLLPWLPSLCIAVGIIAAAQLSEKLLPPRFHIVEETAELAFVVLIVSIVFQQAFGRGKFVATTSPAQKDAPVAPPASP